MISQTMLNLKTIKAASGQCYALRLSNQANLPQSVKPETFWDEWTALQFVKSLNVIEAYWQYLAMSCQAFSYDGWRNSNPWSDIQSFIAHCLIRGSIQVYKVESSDTLRNTAGKRQFKNQYGREFQFLPAANLLTETSVEAQSITNIEEATSAINELNLSDDQTIDLAKSLNIPVPATSVNNAQELNNQVAKAVAEGDVVIVAAEEPAKPQPKMEIIEEVKKAVDLGPHVVGGVVAAAEECTEKKVTEELICKLTKLTVSCDHDGRRQVVTKKTTTTPSLDVVASETSKRGFDKIKAVIEVDSSCPTHTSSSSTIQPSPAKTIKGSLENTYHLACSPVRNPLRYLWLPSIKPTTYKIAASTCDRFSPAAVEVNVFPKIKWNVNVGYSFGVEESKIEEVKPGKIYSPMKKEHNSKAGKFSGKMEFFYDEVKEDFSAEYKNGIDKVLSTLDHVRQKVDSFLDKLGETGPAKLEVFWPNLNIKYETEIAEDKSSPQVVTSYSLSVAANPLIGMKGSLDLFPLFLKAARFNPAAAPIVSVLEAAIEGIGNDNSIASMKADIQLVFSIETKVNIDFSTKGENGRDNVTPKAESAIEMAFQLEGLVGVKGHAWIIKFEKSYKAGIKTGFVGKVAVERDDVGYYWYSRFLFNGLIVYFTKYEKLEKSVTGSNRKKNKYSKLPDQMENSTTTEWTWIEPEPDVEAPTDTATSAGSAATQSSNRHYIIKF